jgi:hypothetical protein
MDLAMRYRQYAGNCLKAAQGTHDPVLRASLTDMAQVWNTLPEQSEGAAPLPAFSHGRQTDPERETC